MLIELHVCCNMDPGRSDDWRRHQIVERGGDFEWVLAHHLIGVHAFLRDRADEARESWLAVIRTGTRWLNPPKRRRR